MSAQIQIAPSPDQDESDQGLVTQAMQRPTVMPSCTLTQRLDSISTGEKSSGVSVERLQLEALCLTALELSGGNYAFVLCPGANGAYAEQFVRLGAVVEQVSDGSYCPCYDTLAHRRPDPMVLSVMRLKRGVQGTPADIGLPNCLPGSHPQIEHFMMVPVAKSPSRTAVLFVANSLPNTSDGAWDSLMSHLLVLGDEMMEHNHSIKAITARNDLDSTSDDSARHYVQLMSASINAVVIVDSAGVITAFNPAAESLFACSSIQALGTSLDQFLPQKFLLPLLQNALRMGGKAVSKDLASVTHDAVAATRSDGVEVNLTTATYHTQIESSVYTTIVFNHQTDTARPAEVISGHEHFQTLTNVAPVGIIQLNADWTCTFANQMWFELSGLNSEETMGERWVDAIHAEDVVATLVDLRECLQNDQNFSTEIRLQCPTGKIRWATLTATVTLSKQNQFTGCLLVLLDTTGAHEASERLRYNATHDVLTGLANRSAFLEQLQARLNSEHKRRSTALLYLDLDGFKTINDTMGHDCGDELLREVAARLKDTVNSAGVCARLGGDEFTIILTSTSDLNDVCSIAESIVRSFNKTFNVFGNELRLSTSVGIAIADEKSDNNDRLIKQADTAVYKAKSSGRSRWVVYTQEFEEEDSQRLALKARVRRATERQEFTLVYQPQFRIDDGAIFGFEALLRWAPDDMPAPDTQILVEVLEEIGLINDVGQWVLETACQQYNKWLSIGLVGDNCSLSVNVSPAQLSLANFASRLRNIMHRSQMPGGSLILEITESALLEKNSNCLRVIDEVKQMGVRLSLDDFGTGYSSLSYLTRLPIDFLKIDKSFVMGMDSDKRSCAIVMSVLAMASALGIEVVAEGVENTAILDKLKDTDCKYGQGYLVSRPQTAEQLKPYLQEHNKIQRDVTVAI